MIARAGAAVLTLCLLAACARTVPPPALGVERPSYTEEGLASWYGRAHNGHKTADGERFSMRAMTAAHRTLPFDTVARVTNLETGRVIKVRINDRGPYIRGRIIDLSAKAASILGIREGGVVRVRIEIYASDQHAATVAGEE